MFVHSTIAPIKQALVPSLGVSINMYVTYAKILWHHIPSLSCLLGFLYHPYNFHTIYYKYSNNTVAHYYSIIHAK